jgi:hypothetical protein
MGGSGKLLPGGLLTHLHHNVQSDRYWAARYNTWLLSKLTPKGVVFSVLFFTVRQLGQTKANADLTQASCISGGGRA